MALTFTGYKTFTAQSEINKLTERLTVVTDHELSLGTELIRKNREISNLQKTNALLKAKIDSQEQKIKKISQFFSK